MTLMTLTDGAVDGIPHLDSSTWEPHKMATDDVLKEEGEEEEPGTSRTRSPKRRKHRRRQEPVHVYYTCLNYLFYFH